MHASFHSTPKNLSHLLPSIPNHPPSSVASSFHSRRKISPFLLIKFFPNPLSLLPTRFNSFHSLVSSLSIPPNPEHQNRLPYPCCIINNPLFPPSRPHCLLFGLRQWLSSLYHIYCTVLPGTAFSPTHITEEAGSSKMVNFYQIKE